MLLWPYTGSQILSAKRLRKHLPRIARNLTIPARMLGKFQTEISCRPALLHSFQFQSMVQLAFLWRSVTDFEVSRRYVDSMEYGNEYVFWACDKNRKQTAYSGVSAPLAVILSVRNSRNCVISRLSYVGSGRLYMSNTSNDDVSFSKMTGWSLLIAQQKAADRMDKDGCRSTVGAAAIHGTWNMYLQSAIYGVKCKFQEL